LIQSCGCPRHGARAIRAGAFTVRTSVYVPGCAAGEHHHDELRFVLPLGGAFETRSARRAFAVEAGCAVVRPAHVAHQDRYSQTVACVTVACDDTLRAGTSSRAFRGDELTLLAGSTFARLAHELGDALQDDEPDAVAALALESTCSELLDAALRRDDAAPWLEALRASLARCEGDERLALGALAQRAGRDPAHVARAFKRRYGVTVETYGRRMRLRKAYRLVRAGDSLAQTAARTGFADQSHLARAFKFAFGVTPGSVRRGTSSSMRSA
jgi:AraC family transcriptional regulator